MKPAMRSVPGSVVENVVGLVESTDTKPIVMQVCRELNITVRPTGNGIGQLSARQAFN